MKKICVLGLGYIGLPTALILASKGFTVVGVDVNKKIVNMINNGKLPFNEPGLEGLYKIAESNFTARTTVENADVYLIAVPTPLEKWAKMADLKYVRTATEMILPYLSHDGLVILESTVPPGTSDSIVIPILEKSGLKPGEFHFAHCPERAIPGNTIYEMIHNDRVIGVLDKKSGELARHIYSSFVKGRLYLTDLRTAEFVKLMENSYRDVNIALANEFAQIGEELNINIWEAIELANKHPRVNILKPGPGVGGHCIPVDPWFLVESSVRSRLVSLAREINDSMPRYVLRIVKEIGIKPPGTITILGVAYKGNIDDTRESPALKFIKLAENEGYTVKIHDPYVRSFEYKIMELKEAVKDSDCLVVITDHTAFKKINPEDVGGLMRNKNIIDCRNLLDRQKWVKAGFNIRILGNKKSN
ncbi:MAG: nucleotide sugar dehydrogenase [Candidatus Njordarchaeum guaymaensis]